MAISRIISEIKRDIIIYYLLYVYHRTRTTNTVLEHGTQTAMKKKLKTHLNAS